MGRWRRGNRAARPPASDLALTFFDQVLEDEAMQEEVKQAIKRHECFGPVCACRRLGGFIGRLPPPLQLTFESSASAEAVLRAAQAPKLPALGRGGGRRLQQYELLAPPHVGYRGLVRIEPHPPRVVDVEDGAHGRTTLTLSAMAYKQVAGSMVLHSSAGGRPSLLVPLRHPPRVWRQGSELTERVLAAEYAFPWTGESGDDVMLSDVGGDEQLWVRTGDPTAPKDSTPEQLRFRLLINAPRVASCGGPLGGSFCLRLGLTGRLASLQARGGPLDMLHRFRMLEQPAPVSHTPIVDRPWQGGGPGLRLLECTPAELSDAPNEARGLRRLPPLARRGSQQPRGPAPLPASPASACCGRAAYVQVLFWLGCLTSQGIITHPLLTEELSSAIASCEPAIAAEALARMLGGRRRLEDPLQCFAAAAQERRGELELELEGDPDILLHSRREPPPDLSRVAVRRVLVTPTRVVGLGRQLDTSNRVLRHYGRLADCFMRVTFADENGNRVQSATARAADDLYARVRTVLREGIWVGRRHYEFLAFSSSQLREQSCWFFAAEEGETPDSIRAWMRDLSTIHVAGKYAARQGMCFSGTVDTASVQASALEPKCIPDIERCRNGQTYCFTDGCGTMSSTLAAEIAGNLVDEGRLPPGAAPPSAVQVRDACGMGRLEVIRAAGFMPAFLNRHVICLLESLVVPTDVFLDMQQQAAAELEAMLEDGAAAQRMLHRFSGDGHEARHPPPPAPSLPQGLLCKARIPVAAGCSLIGVADERGALQPDEAFVQFEEPGTRRLRMLAGGVLVTKNPCVHVGDIRLLQAADLPELRHHRNVIVFPTTGDRPLPNQMAGSDLDGDIYFLSWDERLFPPADRRNLPAMDYSAIQPEEVAQVTTDDVADFFVNYCRNDNLGVISSAWLVHADSSPLVRNSNGWRLSLHHRLYSSPTAAHLPLLQAVDFCKHGKPAQMPLDLRPRSYPDFMRKKDKDSHQSEKALGQMYRAVKGHAAEAKAALSAAARAGISAAQAAAALDPDIRMLGMQEEVEEALGLKAANDNAQARILNHFGILSEAELQSGCIVKLTKYTKRRDGAELRQQARDACCGGAGTAAATLSLLHGRASPGLRWRQHARGVSVQVMEAVRQLRSEYRGEFEAGLPEVPAGQDPAASPACVEAALRQAAAWYCVTYDPDLRTERRKQPFYSFAWLAADELARIKRAAAEAQSKREPVPTAGAPRLVAAAQRRSAFRRCAQQLDALHGWVAMRQNVVHELRLQRLPLAELASLRSLEHLSVANNHRLALCGDDLLALAALLRLRRLIRVKCNEDDTVGDLKKLVAAQTGTRPEKIRIQKWYTVYKARSCLAARKQRRRGSVAAQGEGLMWHGMAWQQGACSLDHITLADYEIHDGMGELLSSSVPYSDANPYMLPVMISGGQRPEIPAQHEAWDSDTASWAGYGTYVALLQRCWAQDPAKRPSFEEIAVEVEGMLAAVGEHGK
eukprot:scaffold15.g4338.t1